MNGGGGDSGDGEGASAGEADVESIANPVGLSDRDALYGERKGATISRNRDGVARCDEWRRGDGRRAKLFSGADHSTCDPAGLDVLDLDARWLAPPNDDAVGEVCLGQ